MLIQIHTLIAKDVVAYRALRLRALREHPQAFGTSFEEEQERSLEEFTKKLEPGPNQVTLGAFQQGVLVGITTLVRPARPKLRHRATLVAMYVAPEARGLKVSQLLLERALETADDWGVSDVKLAVTVGNSVARNLYASAGFTSYGVEPRSLYVDERYYDVEWMNLELHAR